MTDAELKEVDEAIAHLKYSFEQYFMGLERQAPTDEFEALTKRIRNLSTTMINNTALRFQRNNLVQKFNSMQSYWNRILKQIEEGTYKRDRMRAAKLVNKVAENKSAVTKETAQPAAAKSADNSNTVVTADGITRQVAQVGSDHLFNVFNQYQQALGTLGQKSNLTYGALSAALNKQALAIKTKYGCRDVTFKVTVENGKAQIKAVPVK